VSPRWLLSSPASTVGTRGGVAKGLKVPLAIVLGRRGRSVAIGIVPRGDFFLPCALIIRRLQPGERDHLNDILRDNGIAIA
jgi:hypothetical protein